MKRSAKTTRVKAAIRNSCVALAALSLLPHLLATGDPPPSDDPPYITDAFRVGDATQMTRFGSGTTVMLGSYNYGQGIRSLTVGRYNTVGLSTSHSNSLGVGDTNHVNSSNSIAAGSGNFTYSSNTAAFGYLNTASGTHSAAIGWGNQTASTANYSFATGYFNIAGGNASMALGAQLRAYSYASTAVGYGNKPVNGEDTAPAARTTWRDKDTLFVVGNGTGTGSNDRRNALLVTKDGTVTIGKIHGGISMGAFESTAP